MDCNCGDYKHSAVSIEGKIEVAKVLLGLGDDIERVSKATGLTIDEIAKINGGDFV
ncbi:MAG: hypothetical protein ABH870_01565 [bacterium]